MPRKSTPSEDARREINASRRTTYGLNAAWRKKLAAWAKSHSLSVSEAMALLIKESLERSAAGGTASARRVDAPAAQA